MKKITDRSQVGIKSLYAEYVKFHNDKKATEKKYKNILYTNIIYHLKVITLYILRNNLLTEETSDFTIDSLIRIIHAYRQLMLIESDQVEFYQKNNNNFISFYFKFNDNIQSYQINTEFLELTEDAHMEQFLEMNKNNILFDRYKLAGKWIYHV